MSDIRGRDELDDTYPSLPPEASGPIVERIAKVIEDLGRCTKCKSGLTPETVQPDARKANGRSSWCRRCHSRASAAWSARNKERVNARRRARWLEDPERARERRRAQYRPERERWANIQKRYGLSRGDYMVLHDAQGGRCAICQSQHVGPGEWLHVDHDHDTGRVRGLLCGPCNTSLHKMERDAAWFARARDYLQETARMSV